MKTIQNKNLIYRFTAFLFAAAVLSFVTLGGGPFAGPVPALAQETEPPAPTQTPPAAETQDPALFFPAFRNLDVVKLNENQMALLMINNQIEYLMLQIQEKDRQIAGLNAGFEERLQRERAAQAELKTAHAAQLKGVEEKVQAKETELEASRQELHNLEKRVAAFLGDSGIYLVALIAALAGLILGLILSALLNWRRGRGDVAQKAA